MNDDHLIAKTLVFSHINWATDTGNSDKIVKNFKQAKALLSDFDTNHSNFDKQKQFMTYLSVQYKIKKELKKETLIFDDENFKVNTRVIKTKMEPRKLRTRNDFFSGSSTAIKRL